MASTADAEAWETDERGYVFEERLATAAEHKDRGNEHFKAGEWQIALRRYERALYHCAFDPMQMYDLMEKHKAAAYAVSPCRPPKPVPGPPCSPSLYSVR